MKAYGRAFYSTAVGRPTALGRVLSAANYDLKPTYVKHPLTKLNAPGEGSTGTVSLREAIFSRSPIRVDLIHRVVVWQLAKRRQGTAKGKNRAEVSGTTRKAAPQKGGGKARVGSKRAPQFRHGGRAFPKRPRSFDFTLPHKVRQLGLMHALSAKMGQGNLFIVPDLELAEGKTRVLNGLLAGHGWDSVLFVTGDPVNEMFARAAFNLGTVDVLSVRGINVYDIMRRKQLVLSTDALAYIQDELLGDKPLLKQVVDSSGATSAKDKQ